MTGLLYLVVPLVAGAVAAVIAVYLTPEGADEAEREVVTALPKQP